MKTMAAMVLCLAAAMLVAGPVQADTIRAVLARSWGDVGDSELIYSSINANWANYGSTQVEIFDYAGGEVTLAGLQASGADVVIVSDPCGGTQQWSANEAAALQAYANQGHNLVGSFLLLQSTPDNRALAPLWGLRSDLTYGIAGFGGNTFDILGLQDSLFHGIADPYVSSGWPYSQAPGDDLRWDAADLAGAQIVAAGGNYAGVVTLYNAGSYIAVFVSNMPEYHGSVIDERFIYNAIVTPGVPEPATMGLVGLGLAGLVARRRGGRK